MCSTFTVKTVLKNVSIFGAIKNTRYITTEENNIIEIIYMLNVIIVNIKMGWKKLLITNRVVSYSQ